MTNTKISENLELYIKLTTQAPAQILTLQRKSVEKRPDLQCFIIFPNPRDLRFEPRWGCAAPRCPAAVPACGYPHRAGGVFLLSWSALCSTATEPIQLGRAALTVCPAGWGGAGKNLPSSATSIAAIDLASVQDRNGPAPAIAARFSLEQAIPPRAACRRVATARPQPHAPEDARRALGATRCPSAGKKAEAQKRGRATACTVRTVARSR